MGAHLTVAQDAAARMHNEEENMHASLCRRSPLPRFPLGFNPMHSRDLKNVSRKDLELLPSLNDKGRVGKALSQTTSSETLKAYLRGT